MPRTERTYLIGLDAGRRSGGEGLLDLGKWTESEGMHDMRNLVLIAVFFCLTSPVSAQDQSQGGMSDLPCTEFGLPETTPGITCHRVTVPLRSDAPDGPTISLAVARLAALESDGPADPLFMAQGGPGGGTIGTYASYLLANPDGRPTRTREIVLWDQRGTGFSKPLLSCPEYQEAELASATGGSQSPIDALTACGKRLAAEGIDLSAFNSVENGRDVETLRRAFGFEQINFYGVSYGSELAQFVIRDVPAVRSAVLDAVVPISYDLFYEPAHAQQMIGERYLLGCRDDARCNAAFPDLADRYLAMIDRLNETPIPLTIYPLEGERREIPVQLTGDLLESTLFSALYGDITPIVPLIIDRTDKGDYALVSSVLLPSQLGASDIAEAMHLSVTCAERLKSMTPPDLKGVLPRIAEATRQEATEEIAICDAWNVAPLPASDVAPVHSEKPVLMLSGAYDPITPPVYAETLLPQFPAAQHVVFPDGTHGQVVTNRCANTIVSGFLDYPARPVDTTCVPTSATPVITDDDVVFLGVLNRMITQSGVMGLAQAGLAQVPALLIGIVLLVASVGYALFGLIGRLAGWRFSGARGHGFALHAPPWLTFSASVGSLSAIGGLSAAVGVSLVQNQYLGLMGAVPKSLSFLLVAPWVLAALAMMMLITAVQLWRHRLRSVMGRVGFTLWTLLTAMSASSLVVLVM